VTRRLVSAVAAALVIASTLAGTAVAATPKVSLTDIEQDVMCVSCREPLALAQSPQANRERAFVEGLIQQGLTKPQIENALVAQYGTAVLGRPPAHGFNLTVYVLPPALVVLGVVLLAITLPKWRRRAQAAAAAPRPGGPALSAADERRLDEDLSSFA
jgi:cytochrome c-type biogenesis protein CcmH